MCRGKTNRSSDEKSCISSRRASWNKEDHKTDNTQLKQFCLGLGLLSAVQEMLPFTSRTPC